MCALFGWLDYKGIVSNKLLKKLTQSLANAAEERGIDASVIAYVKNGKMTIFKRPKPAHKLRFNAPSGTKAVMGHTRMTTQGNEKFNYNNHPFYGHADKNFSFAHNGVLYNDIELRKEKHLPKTKIETDSYVAVQLIEQQGKLNFDALKNMAESVQGSFCFTVLDENNNLYIVKGSNPMCLLHFVEHHWNELLKFSRRSEYSMNRWAARYGYEHTPKAIMDKAKKGGNGRYAAVNLCNYHTVEFRLFRGTLKYNTFIATIQLVNRICDAAMYNTDESIAKLSWSDFVADITEPELIQYLKERNLYINDRVEKTEEY